MQPQANALQGQPMQPQQQGQPPPPPPSPQQIQDAHTSMKESLQTLDKLIKLPDDQLNFHRVIDSAADEVEKYQLSGGKIGMSAMAVAAEMSDPKFPNNDSSAQQIRQFLQGYFDKIIMAQATVTHKFGAPQQPRQGGQSQ